jgi:hypothetical protein
VPERHVVSSRSCRGVELYGEAAVLRHKLPYIAVSDHNPDAAIAFGIRDPDRRIFRRPAHTQGAGQQDSALNPNRRAVRENRDVGRRAPACMLPDTPRLNRVMIARKDVYRTRSGSEQRGYRLH